jgi:phosphoribosyl 1,2-cyclic phosphate phosphodiesterase
MIACDCATCRSSDPRDQRLRPSICLDVPGGASILVDTTPDLRQQALRFNLRRVDAVLYTHGHADHVLGLDDLRRYNVVQRAAIPCYAEPAVWESLHKTFYYAFDGIERHGGGIPQIDARVIDGPFDVGGVVVRPVRLFHGPMPILGFRFGSFAYLTDCNRIPDESWPAIAGVDTLVLDALRDKPHPTHFTVAEALDAIACLRPKRAFLTHMSHDLGHEATSRRLPPGVELAYDGLVLDVDVETLA